MREPICYGFTAGVRYRLFDWEMREMGVAVCHTHEPNYSFVINDRVYEAQGIDKLRAFGAYQDFATIRVAKNSSDPQDDAEGFLVFSAGRVA